MEMTMKCLIFLNFLILVSQFEFAFSSDYNDDDDEMCGGSIFVSDTMELTYENTEDNDVETNCIWGLSTLPGSVIGVTLKDYKFGGTKDGCTSLTLQQDFSQAPTSNGISIQAQDKDTEISSRSRDSLLVFTSHGGQSFKVELRQIGLYNGPSRINTNITVQNYWSTSSDTFELSYPFDGKSHYQDGEIQMFIFESAVDKKLKFSIDFIDTEPQHDVLSIYKYSKVNRRFLYLQRFSGHLGELPETIFEGKSNEPFFLRFHSDASNSGSGFKISYTYVQADSDALNQVLPEIKTTEKGSIQYGPCGSFVTVDNDTTLAYKSSGNSEEESCVWIIAAKDGGMLGVTLIDQNFDDCSNASAKLNLQTKGLGEGSTIPRSIGAADKGIEIFTGNAIVYLIFTTKESGQSFNLKFRRMGSYTRLKSLKISGHILGGKGIALNTNVTFSYPLFPATTYTGNDRCEVVINGVPKRIIKLTITSIDTELRADYLDIYELSKAYNKFWLLRRLSGRLGQLTTMIFESSSDNQPMVLSFNTDASQNGGGYSMSFSYQPAPDRSVLTPPDPSTFVPCGRLISVPSTTELAYQNPGQSEVTCMWIVTTTSTGIGMTFEDVYKADESSFGQLSFHYGFGMSSMSVERKILGLKDRGLQMALRFSTIVVIYTSSKQGQGFHLRLRDISDGTNRPIPLISYNYQFQSNDGPISLVYPDSYLPRYPDLDARLFIFQSQPRKKIQIVVNFIDTEPDHDHLTVYKYSKKAQQLLTLQRFTGRLNSNVNATLDGNENQPVLMYFRSDGSNGGSGFRLNYFYQDALPEHLTTSTTTMRSNRRFRNRTGSARKKISRPSADGHRQIDPRLSNSTVEGHNVLYLCLSLISMVIAIGALYALYSSKRSLIKDDQCVTLKSIFSCCPKFVGQMSSLRQVPRPGRQRLRPVHEDENF